MATLDKVKVAILVTSGFEEVELTSPLDALTKKEATVDIIAPTEMVIAWDRDHWSEEYPVDVLLENANPNDYDALVLPGGVINPDKLRVLEKAVAFVTHFIEKNKPIAAICHGPWTLVETKKLKGRKMTSYPSIRTDLENAGATWKDQEVVVDKNLITSRRPKDLPAFNKEIIDMLSKLK